MLKTDLHRYYKILTRWFDKAFGLVHKIEHIILFENSKLTYSEINTDTDIDSNIDLDSDTNIDLDINTYTKQS